MIFLTLPIQEALFTTQQFLIIITFILNAMSFFCLLKETPAHQSAIRNYLVVIQVRTFWMSL